MCLGVHLIDTVYGQFFSSIVLNFIAGFQGDIQPEEFTQVNPLPNHLKRGKVSVLKKRRHNFSHQTTKWILLATLPSTLIPMGSVNLMSCMILKMHVVNRQILNAWNGQGTVLDFEEREQFEIQELNKRCWHDSHHYCIRGKLFHCAYAKVQDQKGDQRLSLGYLGIVCYWKMKPVDLVHIRCFCTS